MASGGRHTGALSSLPEEHRPLLANHYELASAGERVRQASLPASTASAGAAVTALEPTSTDTVAVHHADGEAHGADRETLAAVRSALLSQLKLVQEDHVNDPALFPPGGTSSCRCALASHPFYR